jgi:hypothetical protein
LERKNGGGLNSHVGTVCAQQLHDLSDQPLERKLANKKIRGLLILADFPQGHGAGAVATRLLGGSGGWGGLAGSLGRKLLPRGFAPMRFASSLLSTCHV